MTFSVIRPTILLPFLELDTRLDFIVHVILPSGFLDGSHEPLFEEGVPFWDIP